MALGPMGWGGIIGGAAGAAQYPSKARQAREDQYLGAQQWYYSPWTGVRPTGAPGRVNLNQEVLEGAQRGMALGQNIESAEQQNQMNQAYIGAMNRYGQSGQGAPAAPPPAAGSVGPLASRAPYTDADVGVRDYDENNVIVPKSTWASVQARKQYA